MGVGVDGRPFFTMRRVQGQTLAEMLRALARGEAPIETAHARRRLLEAFVRVCLAVNCSHTRGVLHRDPSRPGTSASSPPERDPPPPARAPTGAGADRRGR